MDNKDKEKDKERKIAEMEKHIWKAWGVLRKEGYGTEDAHILLVLLSLYKDDQLTPEALDYLFGGGAEKKGA